MSFQPQEFLSGDSSSQWRLVAVDRLGCDLIADNLRAGRSIRFRAAGSSMLPTLWPGDELVVLPLAAHRIPARGDLILFTRDGRLFAHRVVAPPGDAPVDCLITRGDSLDRTDSPVTLCDVLGAVSAVYRGGRQVALRALNHPSLADRAFALAIRRIDLLRRVALRAHSARSRLRSIYALRCRT